MCKAEVIDLIRAGQLSKVVIIGWISESFFPIGEDDLDTLEAA